MPPMDMPQDNGYNDMGGNFMPQGGMGMSQDNMGMQQPSSQFDTNFDAGVDANEDQDPKKFIQQLTGKLSQSLRKYNNENGQPDVELNKYVAGMVVKQAMDGLSEEDAEDIINKVQSNEEFTPDDQQMPMGDEGQQQMPMDGGNQQQMPMPNNGQMMNERRIKRNKGYLDEIINGVLNKNNNNEVPLTKKEKGHYWQEPYGGK